MSLNDGISTEARPLLISLREKIGILEDSDVRLVLASQSPRRREILDMMGLAGKYTVEPPPLDESAIQAQLREENVSTTSYVERLAQSKAKASAEAGVSNSRKEDKPTYFLGSDTIVELEGRILEKPKSKMEAKKMISNLSGNEHYVHTGVAIYRAYNGMVTLVSSCTETATVTFATLTEADIEAYVDSEEPMDKAGAYGIQGIGGQLVSGLKGDFFTVMGLPMHETSSMLARALMLEILE